MTHPVIWTYFLLANLPFQDFPNHIYCLQHLKWICKETVPNSPGRKHSCNHPPLYWKIQGCWQLPGPYSSAMPNWRVLKFLLDFYSIEKLSVHAEWRLLRLRLTSSPSSHLSLPSSKQENNKTSLILISTHCTSRLPG